MRYHNDLLDDPVSDAGSAGFTGVDMATTPALLPDTVCAAALNARFDTQGLARQRPGVTTRALVGASVIQLVPYDTPDKQALLVIAGGQVRAYNPNNLAAAPATLSTDHYADLAQYPRAAAQLVDTVFLGIGGMQGREVALPPIAGLRYFRFANNALATGTVEKFSDNTTSLPEFSALCAHGFRLFAAQRNTDFLYCSDILDAAAPAHWPLLNGLRVGAGEGDPIVALLSWQESNLVVLKRSGIWIVDTSAGVPAEFVVRRVSSLTGCRSSELALAFGQEVFFVGDHGLFSIGALAQQNSVSRATALSAPVDGEFNPATAQRLLRHREYLLVACAGTTPGDPMRLWAFNTTTRAWCGEWQAAFPQPCSIGGTLPLTQTAWTAAATAALGPAEVCYLADDAGRLATLDDTAEEDTVHPDGTTQPVICDILTKAYDFGEPANWKRLHRLEATFHRSTATSIDIALHLDGEADETPIITASGVTGGFAVPFAWPLSFVAAAEQRLVRHLLPLVRRRFRTAQLRLRDTSSGALAVRSLRLSAFPDTAPMGE